MPEISPRPSEQFPSPETPESDAEKGADVLPIRPDVIVPAPESGDADPEKESREAMVEIRKLTSRIIDLSRDWDQMQEGLAEDQEEAGRQLLKKNVISRVAGWFSRKKSEPIQYDDETRENLTQISWEVRAEIGRLTDIREGLLAGLPPKDEDEMRAECAELDRIYKELGGGKKGD